ncbi:MAG: YraN family protein [Saprospiraceae bacterium]|nr:YraN family protein [Saprospiraceae bacterium]|tara:strand:- start:676 stop:1035 length:360 start_codon:yes stop_codon:yes gene_type:complete
MSDHNELGRKGEEIACELLLKKSYRILEKNWRYKKAEIDIICEKNGVLIFVEVKTRSTLKFGMPEDFVSSAKRSLMFGAANAYMFAINHTWEIRFDVISVLMNSKHPPKLTHFEDAFFS